MIVDVLVYTLARILLVVALTAVIYFASAPLGFQVPPIVAALFGLVIAMPLGIWVLRGLRERATTGIAAVDERRRVDRERLAGRLRGDGNGNGSEPAE